MRPYFYSYVQIRPFRFYFTQKQPFSNDSKDEQCSMFRPCAIVIRQQDYSAFPNFIWNESKHDKIKMTKIFYTLIFFSIINF